MTQRFQAALISVFDKTGLAPLAMALHEAGTQLISTGGTQAFLEELGLPVTAVESLTGYPSILGGRVKTLHPNVFGGILARRDDVDHANDLAKFDIPLLDLVVVDLYPFEETLASGADHQAIIEKIDIGGVALLRAAAKNYAHVAVVPGPAFYSEVEMEVRRGEGLSTLTRRRLAAAALRLTSAYDNAIAAYLAQGTGLAALEELEMEFSADEAPASQSPLGHLHIADLQPVPHRSEGTALRYGENPHQAGAFYGHLDDYFEVLGGKQLSYNNLLDVDAAVALMEDLSTLNHLWEAVGRESMAAMAILKHNNACGVALRPTILGAWEAALSADPTSAFGGIFIANREIDLETAQAIDALFYEVCIAPSFSREAVELLSSKKNRILMRQHVPVFANDSANTQIRSALGGYLVQARDTALESSQDFKTVTQKALTPAQTDDALLAALLAKHTKSNTIVLVKDLMLLASGTGQTSRIDALHQAVAKAQRFGFDLAGATMGSDAFFPFSDCVEVAAEAGIQAIVQPGGSIKDGDSIDAADRLGVAMVTTGVRHFKH